MIDGTCLGAALFFFVSNLLRCIDRVAEYTNNESDFDLNEWESLDTKFIQRQWELRSEKSTLVGAINITNVFAWLLFTVPMVQIGWILSKGRKERVSSNFLMMAVAVIGCVLEIATRAMWFGTNLARLHLYEKANLEDWAISEENDNIGWKVLELVDIITNGKYFYCLNCFIVQEAAFL